ncbi:secretion/DNA translocation related CpaE-like protein [Kribbella sp. VKM Ac-2527]|uniref:Secretion/DNA translocation related CpaE-like protein n=1 Tax=Kribbella caucasensis TaxID=2512215 RepID=A0A4R6KK35_9ACTN|nr:septum site-determining protein Ssd [Kribbella sp. VKM Ac-2527]TDO50852.1 secretion/DNA translocation related CpaE-like protein [Kribbella sp. VKM Ac-2527]
METSLTPVSPVLLATADEMLLDDLLRLTAAAEVTPQVEMDLLGLRRCWQSAVLVVVGQDLAEPFARTQPVRRPGVVVAAVDADDAEIYRRALSIGAENVLLLPADEAALGDKFADTLDGGVRAATTLAFVGGCGGAGATTLAAAVAVTGSRRGLRTMLIDGDPLGGGIDLALGSETGDGARWPGLLNAAGRVSAAALRAALPTVDGLAVLSWDRSDVTALPPEAMRSVLSAAQRSSDLVVVDLPRRADPAAEEAFVRSRCTLLVVPRDVRSCAAAARLVRPLREVATDLRVVAREPGLGGLSAVDVAEHLSLPLAARLRFDRDLPALMDQGRFDPRPRGALGRTAGELLDLFGLHGLAAA